MTPRVAVDVAARSNRQRRPPPQSFGGLRVLCLESRREPELAILVLNYGGRPVVAPSLREVPLESNTQAVAFGQGLIEGDYDIVVLLTGVGTRAFLDVASPAHGRAELMAALARTRVVARGPKVVAVLRDFGITPWIAVPKPNTWREVVDALDACGRPGELSGLRVAIQEYGVLNSELVLALRARGMETTQVPIYRWTLPDDCAPLRAAVEALVQGDIEVVALTTGVQLVHLLRVAAEMALEQPLRHALARTVIASIGPMTSEEVQRQGLTPDLEASNSKMGYLVKEAAEQATYLLRAKRGADPLR